MKSITNEAREQEPEAVPEPEGARTGDGPPPRILFWLLLAYALGLAVVVMEDILTHTYL